MGEPFSTSPSTIEKFKPIPKYLLPIFKASISNKMSLKISVCFPRHTYDTIRFSHPVKGKQSVYPYFHLKHIK